MKRLRPPVEVRIDGLDGDGIGTGLDDRGRRWTIRGAVPGSRVLGGGRCGSGALLDVLEAATGSVEPRCPLHGTCGGCLYQSMPRAAQHAEKLRALVALLSPLGGEAPAAMSASEGDGYGYRNRLELSFGVERFLSKGEQAVDKAGGAVPRSGKFLGFHGAGRFDRIVDAGACAIASPAMNDALIRVRRDVLASPFPTWAAREQTGFWRHLGVREGTEGVVLLVYTAPGGEAEAAWLSAHAPAWGAAAVLWYTTDRTADAAVGELRAVLHGEPRLAVSLGGVPLALSPLAFFQVNPAGAEVLLHEIRAALDERPPGPCLLLDLYCGVGALGLALHASFTAVTGVDLVAEGIAEAMDNARRLGVHADYRAGRAELVLPALLDDHGLRRPDRAGRLAVLVDPPRGGLHPDALRTLAALHADVLVYVACRPSSLLRDGLALLAAGWHCTRWSAVDLFPHTSHVEVVARFERAPAPNPATFSAESS